MKEMPQFRVTGSAADAVESFSSLAVDMQQVGSMLKALMQRKVVEGHDDPIAWALWSSALTLYGRCWGSGKRKGYANSISVPAELRAQHEAHLKQRDQHVAHYLRSNEAEQWRTLGLVDAFANPPVVAGAGAFGIRQLAPTPEQLQEFAKLAEYFEAEFTKKSNELDEWLLTRLQAIPPADLARLLEKGQSVRINLPTDAAMAPAK